MRSFLLITVALMIGGCKPQQAEDIRPWLSVVGAYSLMHPPAIECLCHGTGKVKSGDGLALVDCGCEGGCKCKR